MSTWGSLISRLIALTEEELLTKTVEFTVYIVYIHLFAGMANLIGYHPSIQLQ
jgi:hypothetical protein